MEANVKHKRKHYRNASQSPVTIIARNSTYRCTKSNEMLSSSLQSLVSQL